MFIGAVCIVEKSGNNANKCTSHDWINKMCHIHTMEYYLSIKRNNVLIHTITLMKPGKHYAKVKEACSHKRPPIV